MGSLSPRKKSPGRGWRCGLVAVTRVAEGGYEDEMVDGLGCHWASDRIGSADHSREQDSGRNADDDDAAVAAAAGAAAGGR